MANLLSKAFILTHINGYYLANIRFFIPLQCKTEKDMSYGKIFGYLFSKRK